MAEARTSTDRQPELLTDLPKRSRKEDAAMTAIAAEISRLMGHYWAANEDPRLRAALASDWLDDLREFKPAQVAAACARWRHTHTRRPTPAELRALCAEEAAGGGDPMGLAPEELTPARGVPFGKLNPAEKWSWYARHFARCESGGLIKHLEQFDRRYRDSALVEQAIAELMISGEADQLAVIARARGGDRYRAPAAVSATIVRPDWRGLRWGDLTAAERALAEPEVTRLAGEVKQHFARFAPAPRQRRLRPAFVYDETTPAPHRQPPAPPAESAPESLSPADDIWPDDLLPEGP